MKHRGVARKCSHSEMCDRIVRACATAVAGGLTNMTRQPVLEVIPNSGSWPTDLRENFYDGKQIAQMKQMTDEELELDG